MIKTKGMLNLTPSPLSLNESQYADFTLKISNVRENYIAGNERI